MNRNPEYDTIEQERQCTYTSNIQARSCNHFFFPREKSISIAYFECVFVALGFRNAMRLRQIVVCGLSGSTIFFRISHNRHEFQEKNKIIGPKMCVSVLSRTVTWRIPILRRNERDVIKIVDWCPVKCPLLLSDQISMKLEFFVSKDFRNLLKFQISWKSVTVGTELFHSDGRTDVTKLAVAFCNPSLKKTEFNDKGKVL